ncbi:MAG: DUF3060 domain-containing protein [Verrucomicrobiales bacterium]|nr:DUF3060 domain-containing protein [Verrucomicrobiales bacterium]
MSSTESNPAFRVAVAICILASYPSCKTCETLLCPEPELDGKQIVATEYRRKPSVASVESFSSESTFEEPESPSVEVALVPAPEEPSAMSRPAGEKPGKVDDFVSKVARTVDAIKPMKPVDVPKPVEASPMVETKPREVKESMVQTPVGRTAGPERMVQSTGTQKERIESAFPSEKPAAMKAEKKPAEPVKPEMAPEKKVRPENGKPPVRIVANNIIRIVEVSGEDVEVSGTEGVIVVKGRCRVLTITGMSNRVRCDFAEEVIIEGNGNSVTAETILKGSISGFQNDLSWKKNPESGEPEVKSVGSKNSSGLLY